MTVEPSGPPHLANREPHEPVSIDLPVQACSSGPGGFRRPLHLPQLFFAEKHWGPRFPNVLPSGFDHWAPWLSVLPNRLEERMTVSTLAMAQGALS